MKLNQCDTKGNCKECICKINRYQLLVFIYHRTREEEKARQLELGKVVAIMMLRRVISETPT